ncbi:hypothetical protein JZ751_010107, partial [Albula glossodonta]
SLSLSLSLSRSLSSYLLVLRQGQASSPLYRFSLLDGTVVSAHTKSKLVRSPITKEPQLYLSWHILQRETAVSGAGQGTGNAVNPGSCATPPIQGGGASTGVQGQNMSPGSNQTNQEQAGQGPGPWGRLGCQGPMNQASQGGNGTLKTNSPSQPGGSPALSPLLSPRLHPSPGTGHSYPASTSSSLTALQALSKGHTVVTETAHPQSSPGAAAAGGSPHWPSKPADPASDPTQQREATHHQSLTAPDSKGHAKLLQLLTTKPDQVEPPPLGAPAGSSHGASLKEKHKILHRLLQNSTSPVDLAKITAEATGKEHAPKQEPASPKKKDNALLRHLLDSDDSEVVKTEPGPDCQGKGVEPAAASPDKRDRPQVSLTSLTCIAVVTLGFLLA